MSLHVASVSPVRCLGGWRWADVGGVRTDNVSTSRTVSIARPW